MEGMDLLKEKVMKKLAVLVLVLVSCGTELVIVEPTPIPVPTATPVKIRHKPKKDSCSVESEIRALSRLAVSQEEIFEQCLRLALGNEPVCHELCNP